DAHAAAAGEVLRQIAGPIVLPPSPLGAAALDRLPFTADRVRDTGHAGEQGRRAHLGLGRTVVLDDPARPRGAVGAALQSAGAALLAHFAAGRGRRVRVEPAIGPVEAAARDRQGEG